jgi:hypothetical protein
MLGMIDAFRRDFAAKSIDLTAPKVVQTLSVEELKILVPQHDGWIIGDDPATREVFEAGRRGKLKAAVKWGIGVDNVDFAACRDLDIPITNTPLMFGAEVADVALSYILALARERHFGNAASCSPSGILGRSEGAPGRPTSPAVRRGPEPSRPQLSRGLADRMPVSPRPSSRFVHAPYIVSESSGPLQAAVRKAAWASRRAR